MTKLLAIAFVLSPLLAQSADVAGQLEPAKVEAREMAKSAPRPPAKKAKGARPRGGRLPAGEEKGAKKGEQGNESGKEAGAKESADEPCEPVRPCAID